MDKQQKTDEIELRRANIKMLFSSEDSFQFTLRQHKLYREKWAELKEQYLGKYVLFEDGMVLASGYDEMGLVEDDRAKRGYRDIFVEYVSKADSSAVESPLDIFLQ